MPRGDSSSSSSRPRASKWLLRNYINSHMIWDPTRREEDLLAECIQLHYRSAAPLVMEYIDMVHNAALASPNRENCFGNAEAHGLGPDVDAGDWRFSSGVLREEIASTSMATSASLSHFPASSSSGGPTQIMPGEISGTLRWTHGQFLSVGLPERPSAG